MKRAAKEAGARLLVTDQTLAAASGPVDGEASAWVSVCTVHTCKAGLARKSERFRLVEVDVGSPVRLAVFDGS